MFFLSLVILITALYIVALWYMRRTSYFWCIPLIITILTPLLLKVEVAPAIYLHPSFILLAGYTLVLLLANYQKISYEQIKSMMQLHRIQIGIGLVGIVAVFVCGVAVSLIRTGDIDSGELLRSLLYAGGFSILWLNAGTFWKLNWFSIERIQQLFIVVMALFAVIGISRVVIFAMRGGFVDYWQYGPQYQAIATLGQYINHSGIHLINSGAAESAGWLMALAGITSLVFAKLKYEEMQYRIAFAYSVLFGLFVVGVLYTLSRASLLMLYIALCLFIWVMLRSWRARLMAVLFIIVVSMGVVALFPKAPFVAKSVNTVTVTQKPSTTTLKPRPTKITATNSARVKKGHSATIDDIELEPSAAGRIGYWLQSLELYTESWENAVFGLGLIDLRQEFNLVPHSMLFQQMVKFGILGTMSFLLVWILIGRQILLLWKEMRQDKLLTMALLPIVCITPGWLISNLVFGASFFSYELLIVYFGFWGIVYGYQKTASRA